MRSSPSLNTINMNEKNIDKIVGCFLSLQTFVDFQTLMQTGKKETSTKPVNLGNVNIVLMQLRQRLESCSVLPQYKWLKEQELLFDVQLNLTTKIESSLVVTISTRASKHQLTVAFRHLTENPHLYTWQLVEEESNRTTSNGRKLFRDPKPNN